VYRHGIARLFQILLGCDKPAMAPTGPYRIGRQRNPDRMVLAGIFALEPVQGASQPALHEQNPWFSGTLFSRKRPLDVGYLDKGRSRQTQVMPKRWAERTAE